MTAALRGAGLLFLSMSMAPLILGGLSGCKSTSRNDMIDPNDRASLAVSTADPRGGGPLSIAGALNVLGEARCQREAKCGMLGENRAHADRDGCERDALKTHAGDIELLACKGTIDAKRVAACAEKLRSTACDRDAVAASVACGAAKLCAGE